MIKETGSEDDDDDEFEESSSGSDSDSRDVWQVCAYGTDNEVRAVNRLQ